MAFPWSISYCANLDDALFAGSTIIIIPYWNVYFMSQKQFKKG